MTGFGASEMAAFYDRIDMPPGKRQDPNGLSTFTASQRLEYLTELVQRFVSRIPFENLSIHYTLSRSVATDIGALYKKMLVRPDEATSKELSAVTRDELPLGCGRGGYCMENNALFGTVLKSLDYKVMSVGARVYGGKQLEGFGHMINLVTIAHDGSNASGEDVYVVDVGFGANSATNPLKLPSRDDILDRGHGAVEQGLPGVDVRLAFDDPHEVDEARLYGDHSRVDYPPKLSSQPESSYLFSSLRPQPHCWILQSRRQDLSDAHWNCSYAFTTQQFMLQDYRIMNYYTSTNPKTFFTYQILCVRMLTLWDLHSGYNGIRDVLTEAKGREGAPDGKTVLERFRRPESHDELQLVGQVILNDKSMKVRVGNDNFDIVDQFKSEDERIAALRTHFGIFITDEGKRAIEGTAAAIAG